MNSSGILETIELQFRSEGYLGIDFQRIRNSTTSWHGGIKFQTIIKFYLRSIVDINCRNRFLVSSEN